MSIESNLSSIRERIDGVLKPIANANAAKLAAVKSADERRKTVLATQAAEANRQKIAYLGLINQIEGLEREAQKMPYFGSFFKRREVLRDLARQRKLAQGQYPQGYNLYRRERLAAQQDIARSCALHMRELEAQEKAARKSEKAKKFWDDEEAAREAENERKRDYSETLG